MNNRRLHLLLFATQLLNLLLLTQSWFSIAMKIDGTDTTLGDYDATSTYALAMPTTLLALAASLVAFLVAGSAKRVVLAFGALVTGSLGIWLAIQISNRNISGLDSQLDRLTGIAKTHGVENLEVKVGLVPWAWLAITLLIVVLGVYLAANRSTWIARQPLTLPASDKASSTIDLWEQQRD